MAKHPFAKKALISLQEVHERSVFALNIPMTDKDRDTIKSHILKIAKILNKY